MKKNFKKYSIGVDIGVGSVGWAAIDENYDLLKHRGKNSFGVRLFDVSETAATRRLQRGARRRYGRRIKRIQILQELFYDHLNISSDFFPVLKETVDKSWSNQNNFEKKSLYEVMQEIGYTKEEINNKFPTIYHLRNYLTTNDEKVDKRLIYLAIHNLVKFRGHFLYDNLDMSKGTGNQEILEKLKDFLEEASSNMDIENNNFSDDSIREIYSILQDENETRKDRITKIIKITGKEYKDTLNLLLGLSSNINNVFSTVDDTTKQEYKDAKIKIDYNSDLLEENYEKLGDQDKVAFLEIGKEIYLSIILNKILLGSKTISESKIKKFNYNKELLKKLKDIIYTCEGKEEYKKIFVTQKKLLKNRYQDGKDNIDKFSFFDRYINNHKEKESFYKLIKDKLEKIKVRNTNGEISTNEKIIDELIMQFNEDEFLFKLDSIENSAIPKQNNTYEAELILKNQQKFYNDITDDFISKVEQIISFRIPYFIGPLVKNEEKPKWGWNKRKDVNLKTRPWTFSEAINEMESGEKFIRRMTNKCTYLIHEDVAPKKSLLVQEYEVLNELNSSYLFNENASDRKSRTFFVKEERKWIIDNVFKKNKIVKHSMILEAIKNSPFQNLKTAGKKIGGTQKEKEYATSLSTYIDMSKIFGEITDDNIEMIEKIVNWITVFNETSIIKDKIREEYKDISEDQINRIVKLNYTGWSRISNKLINGLTDKKENRTIIEIMKNSEESRNFMSIITDSRLGFEDKINIENNKEIVKGEKIKYSMIDELQGSPSIKRGIWQTIKIIEELADIYGDPESITLEVAREDGKKGKRTQSRKDQWKKIKDNVLDESLINGLDEKNFPKDIDYSNERVWLYLLQGGKCMYSQEPLKIEELQNYNVDHILPQRYVKDDSIDNKVLVKTIKNMEKSGEKLPLDIIPQDKKGSMIRWWQSLKANGMISDKKFFNLMKTEFSNDDKDRFIARQLVETRQIIKHVENILRERFENSDSQIYSVKAGFTSQLRRKIELPKSREINDKHHAIDALLAVWLQKFVIEKYGKDILSFDIRKEYHNKFKSKTKEDVDKERQIKEFFILKDALDWRHDNIDYSTGEIIKSISLKEYFYEMMFDKECLYTKKIGAEDEMFFKQTLFSPKIKKAKYDSSKNDKGVYSEMKNAYSLVISHIKNDAKEYELIDVYVIEREKYKNKSDNEFLEYLMQKENKIWNFPKIEMKLLKGDLIIEDGFPFRFVSSTTLNKAKQLKIDINLYIELSNELIRNKDGKLETEVSDENYDKLKKIVLEDYGKLFSEGQRVLIENSEKNIKNIKNLLSITALGAGRVSEWKYAGMYAKTLDLNKSFKVTQSITGLNEKKEKIKK